MDGAKWDDREVVFSGTDYGVATMSTTVSMPMQRYRAHVKLYNHQLSALSEDNKINDDKLDGNDEDIVSPRREQRFRITAQQINQMSLSRSSAKKREKRKVGERPDKRYFSHAKLVRPKTKRS